MSQKRIQPENPFPSRSQWVRLRRMRGGGVKRGESLRSTIDDASELYSYSLSLAHMLTHKHTHTCTHKSIHTHGHTYTLSVSHTLKNSLSLSLTNTHTHTFSLSLSCRNTHIHTHCIKCVTNSCCFVSKGFFDESSCWLFYVLWYLALMKRSFANWIWIISTLIPMLT